MENQMILMKENLGFFGIIKETLRVPVKSPRFIFLSFITSLPLFCSMFLHEASLQQILLDHSTYKDEPYYDDEIVSFDTTTLRLDRMIELIKEATPKFLLNALLYLAAVHLFDLLNSIVILRSASDIYGGEENSVSMKELLFRPIKKISFQGPFITSIYALILASLTSIGLLSLAASFYISYLAVAFNMLVCGALFIALLIKHIEWSAVWNMGVVISILEQKNHGYIALGASAYLSRGRRRLGFLLMLPFFIAGLALRSVCVYLKWNKKGNANVVLAITTGLLCFVNVTKWVVVMLYFYDCKKRFREKKIDAEEGKATNIAGNP